MIILFLNIIKKMKTLKFCVEILQGNVSTAIADGFVVPQHYDGYSHTGVSAAFLHTEYYEGIMEYDEKIGDKPLSPGDVIITERTESSKFINVVTLGLEKEEAFENIQTATSSVLHEAEENNLWVLAIPALGTGKSGCLSFEQSAKAMLSAIAAYESRGVLKQVKICILHSPEAYDEYKTTAENYLASVV